MNWYLEAMKKYAVFSGRARRKEYWMFFLFNLIIAFGLGLVEGILDIAPESDDSILATIYQLAVLIPSIAVGVRRMHDTDHSGWWLLLPIVNLVFACTEGTRGDNRFGADPKIGTQEGTSQSVSDQLKQLNDLKESSILTEEEYESKRKALVQKL